MPREILHRHKVEKPFADRDFKLKGLITVKDIQKQIDIQTRAKDSLGRLRMSARRCIARDTPSGPRFYAHADVPVVDTAHGHSQNWIWSQGSGASTRTSI